MSMIREAITKCMEGAGLTVYQVAKKVEGKVPMRTVYAFLRGEKDTGTETASEILMALGLRITPGPKPRGRRAKKS
jgi:predicted transcriptional regulator